MRLRIGAVLFAICVLQLVVIGCGGSSSSSGNSTPPGVTLKSIRVNPGAATVIVGKMQNFTATGTYSDGSTKDITSSVTWSSAAANIVSITTGGVATAVPNGVAQGGSQTVSVTAKSGSVSGAAQMTVTDYLQQLAVSPSSASINAGTTEQFHVIGTYQDGGQPELTSGVVWSISPASVATINSSGLAMGLSAGSATVTAKVAQLSSSAGLTIGSTLASITLTGAGNSTSLYVAGALQMTATGNYTGGPSQDLTSSAIWSIATYGTTGGEATVANGLVEGTHGGQITVTATVNGVSGSLKLTVTPIINSLLVGAPCPLGFECSTQNPLLMGVGVLVGSAQQFQAIALYNDGTTADVSTSATWSSTPSGAMTFSSGATGEMGTAASAGQMTVQASVTNPVSNLPVSASTVVNSLAAASNSGKLNDGPYTFTLLGANNNGPVYYVGSFTATGGVISGELDVNAAGSITSQVALGGAYVVFPDGRGEIQFNQNAAFNNPGGVTLRMILSQGGGTGKLMEFDGLGTMSGSLWQQSGAFTTPLEGNYIFRANGMDALTNPLGIVGLFNATGGQSNTITGGTIDSDDYSVVLQQQNLSGSSISAIDTNGRGTFTLIQAGVQTNYVFYVVSAPTVGSPSGLANFMETDPGPSASAVAGTLALQTGSSGGYTVGTLDNGHGYGFLFDRPIVQGNCETQCQSNEFAQVGEYAFVGSGFTGTIAGVRDDTGETNNPFSVTGTIALGGGITGRGTINSTGTDNNRAYVMYMVSPTQAYVLQNYTVFTQTGQQGSRNAATGEMDEQSVQPGNFDATTMSGEYALAASDVVTPGLTTELLWLNFDGNGNVSGMLDASVGSSGPTTTLSSSAVPLAAAYKTIGSNSGRYAMNTVSVPNGPSNNFAIYSLGSQGGWVLNVNPAMDGTLNQQ